MHRRTRTARWWETSYRVHGRRDIGYIYLSVVDSLLDGGGGYSAHEVMTLSRDLIPTERRLVDTYDAEALILMGHQARSAGGLPRAIEHYDEALSREPNRIIEITGYLYFR